mgnify:CR=1 FL=1
MGVPRQRMAIAASLVAIFVGALPLTAAAQPTPSPAAAAGTTTDPDLTLRYLDDPDLANLGPSGFFIRTPGTSAGSGS